LPARAGILLLDLGLDLGEEVVQRLGASDGAFQGLPFSEGDDVLGRVLQTNPVSSALCAQQFYFRSGQIGHHAGYVSPLLDGRNHLRHLDARKCTQAGPEIGFGEDCFVSMEPALRHYNIIQR
jgi:hypothetical protein